MFSQPADYAKLLLTSEDKIEDTIADTNSATSLPSLTIDRNIYLQWALRSKIEISKDRTGSVIFHTFSSHKAGAAFAAWLRSVPHADFETVQLTLKNIPNIDRSYPDDEQSILSVSPRQFDAIMGHGSFDLLFDTSELTQEMEFVRSKREKRSLIEITSLMIPIIYFFDGVNKDSSFIASLWQLLQKDRVAQSLVNQLRIVERIFFEMDSPENEPIETRLSNIYHVLLVICEIISTARQGFNTEHFLSLNPSQRLLCLQDYHFFYGVMDLLSLDDFTKLLQHFTPREAELFLEPRKSLLDSYISARLGVDPPNFAKDIKYFMTTYAEKAALLISKFSSDKLKIFLENHVRFFFTHQPLANCFTALERFDKITLMKIIAKLKLGKAEVTPVVEFLLMPMAWNTAGVAEMVLCHLLTSPHKDKLLSAITTHWLAGNDLPYPLHQKLKDVLGNDNNRLISEMLSIHPLPTNESKAFIEEKIDSIKTGREQQIPLNSPTLCNQVFAEGIAWKTCRFLKNGILKPNVELQSMLQFMLLTESVVTGVKGNYFDFATWLSHAKEVFHDRATVDLFKTALENKKSMTDLRDSAHTQFDKYNLLTFSPPESKTHLSPSVMQRVKTLVDAAEDSENTILFSTLSGAGKIKKIYSLWKETQSQVNKIIKLKEDKSFLEKVADVTGIKRARPK